MTWGERAAEQYEKDQPSEVATGHMRTVSDFQVGDPVWYTPLPGPGRYRGEIDGHADDGLTLKVVVEYGLELRTYIAGQYAISQGRLYRRDDGEEILRIGD